MHITFELETALQGEFKVFLFVRHNSHYQVKETNFLVFQNFCIHFPFSDFSSPCKSSQECCPLQTQNSRMSLTDSKGTVCTVTVLHYPRWQSYCNTTFRHKEYSKLYKHKWKSYCKLLWTHTQIYYTQASLTPFKGTYQIHVWVVNPQLNNFFI